MNFMGDALRTKAGRGRLIKRDTIAVVNRECREAVYQRPSASSVPTLPASPVRSVHRRSTSSFDSGTAFVPWTGARTFTSQYGSKKKMEKRRNVKIH